MKILFLGDIVGKPARSKLKEELPKIIKEEGFDFIIANGENAASGSGLTRKVAEELFELGIDIVTLGDHAYRKRDILSFISSMEIVRPLNISTNAAGRGYIIKEKNGKKIAVINLLGRVFMNPIDCPFKAVNEILTDVLKETKAVIVDMHAEATSEKKAMGYFLSNKVSAVLGTHTHVPTADEEIRDKHTAYITDVGMCGSSDSILGRKKENIIERFVTNMPVKFDIAEKEVTLQGVILEVDEDSGRSTLIKRVEYK